MMNFTCWVELINIVNHLHKCMLLLWTRSQLTSCIGSQPQTLHGIHHQLVVLYNKFLLTVGGRQQSRTSEVYIFNPSTGQWKHLINIPAARSGPAVVGVADSILVIGGFTYENKCSNTIWIGVFE